MPSLSPKHILISRVDAIGDVVLTLPLCGIIKSYYAHSKISFLGRTYTKDLIVASKYVDEFLNYNDWESLSNEQITHKLAKLSIDCVIHVLPHPRIAFICKKAGIGLRVGTSHRLYHWITCNRLINLGRRRSNLHEAQLNICLLKALGIQKRLSLYDIPPYYGLCKVPQPKEKYHPLLEKNKFNLILHPKSNGNGAEWDLKNYTQLVNLLDPKKFQIFITGSTTEQATLEEWVKSLKNNAICNLVGKLSLAELIAFIAQANGLVACGTGPLHLAAALGIRVLGLYPTHRPIHAERWGPIGKHAKCLVGPGKNLTYITPDMVYKNIMQWNA